MNGAGKPHSQPRPEVIRAHLKTLVETMVGTIEREGEAQMMLAGLDGDRWVGTVVPRGWDEYGEENIALAEALTYLVQAKASTVICAADVRFNTAGLDDEIDIRPAEDPKARDAIAVHWETVWETGPMVLIPYGRADDGTIRWEPSLEIPRPRVSMLRRMLVGIHEQHDDLATARDIAEVLRDMGHLVIEPEDDQP